MPPKTKAAGSWVNANGKPAVTANPSSCPWAEKRPTITHVKRLVEIPSTWNRGVKKKLKKGQQKVCSACAKAPAPCSDASNCWCVPGPNGANNCEQHSNSGEVTMSASGGCSNCTTDNSERRKAARGKKRDASSSTSELEASARHESGLAKQAPRADSRRSAVSFADAVPTVWATIWYYYLKWGGGVPVGANRAKWGEKFAGLARRCNVVGAADRDDTAAEVVERLYAYINSQHKMLLGTKEYRMTNDPTDACLDWRKIVNAKYWS